MTNQIATKNQKPLIKLIKSVFLAYAFDSNPYNRQVCLQKA